MKRQNTVGQRFGKLTVVGEVKVGRRIKRVCECECGGTITTYLCSLKSGATSSCGCYRREVAAKLNTGKCGAEAPNFRGGRKLDTDGYIRLLVGKRQYKPEHVVIMERHLGRKLFPDETVHHKNGIRDDNRLDNLELRASNHGKGQSAVDLLAWAREVIRRYDGVEL